MIALINMPFGPANRASIQLGILKAILDEAAIESEQFFFNVDFLDLLRQHGLHEAYSSTLPALIAEWFFTEERRKPVRQLPLVGAPPTPEQRLIAFANAWGVSLDELYAFRDDVAAPFIDTAFENTDWSRFDAVAFSCTFPQLCASFALARRIKEVHPQIATIFGGAMSQVHPEAAAEFMRVFDFVDFVVVGEAEPVFEKLCRSIIDDEDDHDLDVDGLFCRREGEIVSPSGPAIETKMDSLPFPNYSAFLDKRADLPPATRTLIEPDVPIEMSRGCAWAVKKVCSFCGFYPDGGFRLKPHAQVLEEIDHQRRTTGWVSFHVADAYVVPTTLRKVFRRLPSEQPGLAFPFVELRANVSKEDIETLADAGVHLVQPGIECFEENLLVKVKKGVSLVENILFLKWCVEQGIDVSYNLLLGVPDADADDVVRQNFVMEHLFHLPPPYPTKVNVVRGTIYEKRPDLYDLHDVKPDPFYSLLYPQELDVSKIAYEFVTDLDLSSLMRHYERSNEVITSWHARWDSTQKPSLTYLVEDDSVVVDDRRSWRAPDEPHKLIDLSAELFFAIVDDAKNVEQLTSLTDRSASEVETVLEDFIARRWVLKSEGKFLALATNARRRKRLAPKLVAKLKRARVEASAS